MPKYEIMMITDPVKDINETEVFVQNIFGKDIVKFEKMDRSELAYSINNSKIAIYVLMEVNTSPENIKEFSRKVNIDKSIWRELVINLDVEKEIDTVKHIRSESDVQKMREEFAAKRKAAYEAKKVSR